MTFPPDEKAMRRRRTKRGLYVVYSGKCYFCGGQHHVVASEEVDPETPPGICEGCAVDALKLHGTM
jgi:hypothetical protein